MVLSLNKGFDEPTKYKTIKHWSLSPCSDILSVNKFSDLSQRVRDVHWELWLKGGKRKKGIKPK